MISLFNSTSSMNFKYFLINFEHFKIKNVQILHVSKMGKTTCSLSNVLYLPGVVLFAGVRLIHYNAGSSRILAYQRISPHNKQVLDFMFGTLLGDGCADVRSNATRLLFMHTKKQKDYLFWIHEFLSKYGYCSLKKPVAKKVISNLSQKEVTKYAFSTYSYTSLNFLHALFYAKNTKKIPCNKALNMFLTPFALAVWIMDDGCKANHGFLLCRNSYSQKDLERLQKFLIKTYKLKTSLQKHGITGNQFRIYIWKESLPTLYKLVEPYLIPSMKYKFNF